MSEAGKRRENVWIGELRFVGGREREERRGRKKKLGEPSRGEAV
jgi:hypothetical protein